MVRKEESKHLLSRLQLSMAWFITGLGLAVFIVHAVASNFVYSILALLCVLFYWLFVVVLNLWCESRWGYYS